MIGEDTTRTPSRKRPLDDPDETLTPSQKSQKIKIIASPQETTEKKTIQMKKPARDLISMFEKKCDNLVTDPSRQTNNLQHASHKKTTRATTTTPVVNRKPSRGKLTPNGIAQMNKAWGEHSSAKKLEFWGNWGLHSKLDYKGTRPHQAQQLVHN